MVISQDVVRREMLWEKDGKDTKALPLLIELLKYGKQNSEITILEGMLFTEYYRDLFETAVKEYGSNMFAYYFDLPFEETVCRHQTKPNRMDFGEEHMRRWWREHDCLDMIPETMLTKEMSIMDVVEKIFNDVKHD